MFYPLIVFPPNVEAAAIAGVAGGRPVLFDLDDNRISVTISQNLHHILSIAGLFTLHPVLVAGTAEKPGFTVLQGQIEGLFIHERYHQHFTIFIILDDGRDQPPILSKSI